MNEASNITGGIFGEGPVLDYIMVFILALLLGACVTVFCLRLRQLHAAKEEEDSPRAQDRES